MNNEKKNSSVIVTITGSTFISFTITILCWAIFELIPNWDGTGMIATAEAVRDIFVSLGICICMSGLGYACFSELFATKASMTARFFVFSVVGYAIIAAWVFGSGWCPLKGYGLFTVICIIAFVISALATYICTAAADRKLKQHLDAYKGE